MDKRQNPENRFFGIRDLSFSSNPQDISQRFVTSISVRSGAESPIREIAVKELSYDEFVRAHDLRPLNPIKKACEVLNVGHSRFYEDVVNKGEIQLVRTAAARTSRAIDLYNR